MNRALVLARFCHRNWRCVPCSCCDVFVHLRRDCSTHSFAVVARITFSESLRNAREMHVVNTILATTVRLNCLATASVLSGLFKSCTTYLLITRFESLLHSTTVTAPAGGTVKGLQTFRGHCCGCRWFRALHRRMIAATVLMDVSVSHLHIVITAVSVQR